jgi:WhiB family transcriptional regulator, redox-sensing transcriptional regulator
MTISPARTARAEPAELTNAQLYGLVFSPLASCAYTALDPDEWFPVATGIAPARAEAARALGVCAVCPVRAECLELSLRHWAVVGQHGIWGGLVETERDTLRREWLNGVPVTVLLSREIPGEIATPLGGPFITSALPSVCPKTRLRPCFAPRVMILWTFRRLHD